MTRIEATSGSPPTPGRRVVITGIGVIAPGGVGTKVFWDTITSGRTATRSISLFDATPFRSRIAGEVDFDPAAEGLGQQQIRRLDRAAQFALVATREAVADSGLDGPDPYRTGVTVGSAVGASMSLDREYAVVSDAGQSWTVDHGTKQNDRHETAAFRRSLGAHSYATPVSSIKSVIGHSLGAVGAIEIAASALAMEHGTVPPTANLHEPDPECDLDYVPLVAREHRTDAVLTVGGGFGGFQSAMVLARPERRTA